MIFSGAVPPVAFQLIESALVGERFLLSVVKYFRLIVSGWLPPFVFRISSWFVAIQKILVWVKGKIRIEPVELVDADVGVSIAGLKAGGEIVGEDVGVAVGDWVGSGSIMIVGLGMIVGVGEVGTSLYNATTGKLFVPARAMHAIISFSSGLTSCVAPPLIVTSCGVIVAHAIVPESRLIRESVLPEAFSHGPT